MRNACHKADVGDWRWTARIPGTCIRVSALDAGRNYSILIVFAEDAWLPISFRCRFMTDHAEAGAAKCCPRP